MVDREKVINGLDCCLDVIRSRQFSSGCGFCPYIGAEHCNVKMIEDAIALLKDHGHGERFTVIDNKTGKEADTYNIALHEGWAKHLCYCDMEGWAITDDGTLLLVDECGRFAYADRERFKVVWDG